MGISVNIPIPVPRPIHFKRGGMPLRGWARSGKVQKKLRIRKRRSAVFTNANFTSVYFRIAKSSQGRLQKAIRPFRLLPICKKRLEMGFIRKNPFKLFNAGSKNQPETGHLVVFAACLSGHPL
jgi:hypothetical protein